jgi:putative Ca2+/H+ antiporter (TMEM165/GDT1 family)
MQRRRCDVSYLFLVAFVLIMAAELGDKSQLLALVMASRYKAWQVLLGIFLATFTALSITTLVGQTVGSRIPDGVLPWVTGVLFIGFGIWTLRGDGDEDLSTQKNGRFGPVLTTAVAFFLAELGDKTQIMTLAIAADAAAEGVGPVARFFAVTLGATLGMVAADAIAIMFGRLLGRRLPERLLRRISAAVFILFGIASIASALAGGVPAS